MKKGSSINRNNNLYSKGNNKSGYMMESLV